MPNVIPPDEEYCLAMEEFITFYFSEHPGAFTSVAEPHKAKFHTLAQKFTRHPRWQSKLTHEDGCKCEECTETP